VLSEIVRKVLLTYWNTVSFLVLYANASGWTRASGGPGSLLDRWALSELHSVVRDVTALLERFDTAAAGRRLAGFIDDLSNWYVRRSRRRFWDGDSSAFATLYECVSVLTLLMAPFTPFITDYLWGVLRVPEAPDSVHLASWPSFDPSLIDPALSEQMGLVRRLVELGRSARAAASVRTRQPLGRALIGAPGFSELPAPLRDLIAAELNVRSADVLSGQLVDYVVKPNFRSLGRRFGALTPTVASAVTAAPASSVAAAVLAGGTFAVAVDGSPVEIGAEDVIVTQTPRAGWAVATEAGETVALDITVTPELRREGRAREVIRLVQEARKNDGLDVTDRIMLHWSASDPEVAAALTEHAELIAGEVLAVEFAPGYPSGPGWTEHSDPDLGLKFWLRRALPADASQRRAGPEFWGRSGSRGGSWGLWSTKDSPTLGSSPILRRNGPTSNVGHLSRARIAVDSGFCGRSGALRPLTRRQREVCPSLGTFLAGRGGRRGRECSRLPWPRRGSSSPGHPRP
jgi:isoleucyl-tRNA synthetase